MRRLMVAIGALGLVAAACSSTPSTEEATANLCSSLSSFASSVQQTLGLSADSTVDDAEATLESVQSGWDDVKEDAEVVNEAATAEAEAAIDDFKAAIDDLSGDATIGETVTQAASALGDLTDSLQAIANSITCD